MKKYLLLLGCVLSSLVVFPQNKCGDNLYWDYYDGLLTISGEGDMYDFTGNMGSAPWKMYESKITAIFVDEGVTSIGRNAFHGLANLTAVNLPKNSLQKIAGGAFSMCITLPSFTIPRSVTSIDPSAFFSCLELTSLSVASGNPIYDSRNNCNAIVETASNKIVVGCRATKIPNTVTSIGPNAFRECRNLSSISIPSSVTSIGEWAFYYCDGLTSIVIPNSVTSIGDRAFGVCSRLSSLEISNSLTSIGGYTFEQCRSLTSITIPNSVQSIGYSAFGGCTSVTSVSIPNSVTSLDQTAFSNAPIETLYIDNEKFCSKTYYGDKITHVIMGNHMNTIPAQAFANAESLTSVTIPNTIKGIGFNAFLLCIYEA